MALMVMPAGARSAGLEKPHGAVQPGEADLAVLVAHGDLVVAQMAEVLDEERPLRPGRACRHQAVLESERKVGAVPHQERIRTEEAEGDFAVECRRFVVTGIRRRTEEFLPKGVVQKAGRDRLQVEFGVEPEEVEAWLFGHDDFAPLEVLAVQRVHVVS